MKKVKTIPGLRKCLSELRKSRKGTGLVPTMGCLHGGHLSLIRQAGKDNGIVVLSVFVNPLQFGRGEDFKRYPRDPRSDALVARDEGVDVFFEPGIKEMYPADFRTHVEVEGLGDFLCGKSRPCHFRGVATVVAKLLNIVRPDFLYLGQKDAQQAVILKKMADDLDFHARVRVLPTVRESDGLAMSSRNRYLSAEERKSAPLLYKGLLSAKGMISAGVRSSSLIKAEVEKVITADGKFFIDYVEVVDARRLEPVGEAEGAVLVAAAVRLGKTRLIDNILVGADSL